MDITLTIKTPDGVEYKRVVRWLAVQTVEAAQKWYAHHNYTVEGHEIIKVDGCLYRYTDDRKFIGAPLIRERY